MERLFTTTQDSLVIALKPRFFPAPLNHMEVCFAGRSNSGKSSLLNKICGRKDLSRTSSRPGRTQHSMFVTAKLNQKKPPNVPNVPNASLDKSNPAHKVFPEFRLIDLPGYGYAKMSAAQARDSMYLIHATITERPLCCGVMVMDIRRNIEKDEKQLISILKERGIPTLVLANKADKLSRSQQKARLQALSPHLNLKDDAIQIIACSAATGLGMPEIGAYFASLLSEQN